MQLYAKVHRKARTSANRSERQRHQSLGCRTDSGQRPNKGPKLGRHVTSRASLYTYVYDYMPYLPSVIGNTPLRAGTWLL